MSDTLHPVNACSASVRQEADEARRLLYEDRQWSEYAAEMEDRAAEAQRRAWVEYQADLEDEAAETERLERRRLARRRSLESEP